MRVLLIDGYPSGDPNGAVVATAMRTLEACEHEVERLSVDGWAPMSAAERAAYHEDEPLVTDEARVSAAAVRSADALLFCYPTMTFTVPASVKAWLERVLVPGVAFVFDAKGRVRPGMTNVRRLGAITTTPHSSAKTRRVRDAGRRTILWTLRLSCHKRCRRTFVAIPTDSPDHTKITTTLKRW